MEMKFGAGPLLNPIEDQVETYHLSYPNQEVRDSFLSQLEIICASNRDSTKNPIGNK